MIFQNEQNFKDRHGMTVRCSCCNKVLYHEKAERHFNDIRGYLELQVKKRQIHYCTNCGRKLTIPNVVEYGKYTVGLGNGKEMGRSCVGHVG